MKSPSVKEIDGEPWQVAAVAGKRVAEALSIAAHTIEELFWAARGSWMSQEEYRTGRMPEAGEFEKSPLGRKLQVAAKDIGCAQDRTQAATLAASHDPRSF